MACKQKLHRILTCHVALPVDAMHVSLFHKDCQAGESWSNGEGSDLLCTAANRPGP